MTIDVIIPNYNGADLIRKNLESVYASIKDYHASITIVDDASTESDYSNLQEYIHEFEKKHTVSIRLLCNNHNMGFSSTVNKGALSTTSDLLVLMNSDAVPEKDFLKSVVPKFEKNERLFGVGCMDKSIEGKSIVLRGRGIGAFQRGMVTHRKGEVDKESTLWVSGGSSIVRSRMFKEIGGFDPNFNPFYYEDIDLSYRAQKAGYETVFDRESIVEHRHEEGAIKKHHSQFKIKTVAHRNQFFLVWKNITDKRMLLEHIIFLPYHFLNTLVHGDLAFWYGFFLAVLKLPAILDKRKAQKKLFVLSDSAIFSKFNS